MRHLILAAAVSCFSALLVTPVARRWAIRYGLVDAPDGFRKLHARQVPLGGGLAIMLACALTVILAILADVAWAKNIQRYPQIAIGIASGALLLGLIGLLDDRYRIRGRQKLLGQIAAGLLAVSGGLVVEKIGVFGWEFELGVMAVPLTLCWLIGAINALNLIDGVDGLATTVGLIICVTLCVISAVGEHYGDAAATATLAGALLGFLPYNWRPAKIFLGDAGSMFVGFMLGVLAIRGNLKGPATVALVAPAAVWAIPLFDVVVAILRRKLTGQSIYATDRGHLHHVLQRYGLGHAGTVLVIAGLCLVCSSSVIVSMYLQNEFAALMTVGVVISMLIVTRSFGHTEFHLMAQKLSGFAASLFKVPSFRGARGDLCSRFHGNREFEQAWEALLQFAQRFGLSSLNFNINAPMLGEVYHAEWQGAAREQKDHQWTSDLPLIWGRYEIGRIAVCGAIPDGKSPFSWSSELMDALCPFERIVIDLLGGQPMALDELQAVPQAYPLRAYHSGLGEDLLNVPSGEREMDLPACQATSPAVTGIACADESVLGTADYAGGGVGFAEKLSPLV